MKREIINLYVSVLKMGRKVELAGGIWNQLYALETYTTEGRWIFKRKVRRGTYFLI